MVRESSRFLKSWLIKWNPSITFFRLTYWSIYFYQVVPKRIYRNVKYWFIIRRQMTEVCDAINKEQWWSLTCYIWNSKHLNLVAILTYSLLWANLILSGLIIPTTADLCWTLFWCMFINNPKQILLVKFEILLLRITSSSWPNLANFHTKSTASNRWKVWINMIISTEWTFILTSQSCLEIRVYILSTIINTSNKNRKLLFGNILAKGPNLSCKQAYFEYFLFSERTNNIIYR